MIKFNVFQNNKELKSVRNKGFLLKNFNELLVDNSKKIKSYKTNLYSNSGQTPIIDQGSKKISGYTDNRIEDSSCYPAIIFGDHTRIIKYIDFPFFRGADGTKVLNTSSNENEIKYFYYYLKYIKIPDDGYSRHFKYLKEVVFPIPKLSVQRKIVVLLDLASELIEKRKDQIAEMDKLIQSVFYEMFGDPVTNSKTWKKKKLSEMGIIARGKSKHRPRNAPELLGGNYPLIQTGDVANSGIFIKEYKSTYSELGLMQSKMWDRGTLCITIAANIAKTGILSFDACFPDSIVGMICNENTNEIFMQVWFSFFQQILEKNAPESAQKNINLQILGGLEVICPPIKMQNKFASIVEEIESQKKAMEESLDEMENNFNALMQKSFRGELFPEE